MKNGDRAQRLDRHFLRKPMPSESFCVPDPISGTTLFMSNEVIDPARTLVLLVRPKLEIADG